MSAKKWLVTGAAGFIGSGLVESLLAAGGTVVGVDNFITGRRENLEDVRGRVGEEAWERFEFQEGDLREPAVSERAVSGGVKHVLHQAALGSVPRSLLDPLATHSHNVTATLNLFNAAKDVGIKRVIYASSSSVYGDHPALPKVESQIGRPLSPYAVSKLACEHYASVFASCYGMEMIGLRYFNVFGRRQDPAGQYAAVIPKWISTMLSGEAVEIFGDGETSRDFCYLDNVIQANLLAARAALGSEKAPVLNIAAGGRMTLNELHEVLTSGLAKLKPDFEPLEPCYLDFRPGDVRHSQADISAARQLLGYAPRFDARQGLAEALDWYCQ